MNGNKLYEELFTMNSERTETKKNLLKLFKSIDWSEYKKYGFDINDTKSDSVEFAVYKKSEIESGYYDKIEGLIKEWMPEIFEDDNWWWNPIYRCLRNLSSDKVLKTCLENEHGIYFYDDSQSVRMSITKEGLSQL